MLIVCPKPPNLKSIMLAIEGWIMVAGTFSSKLCSPSKKMMVVSEVKYTSQAGRCST